MTIDASAVTRRNLLRTLSAASCGAVTIPFFSKPATAQAATRAAAAPRPSHATSDGAERPMSYAPLEAHRVAILFADLQTGIIERSATNDLAHLRRAVGALAKLAHLLEIPVIVTTAPSDGGPIVTAEIAAALGSLPQYTRTTTDAFTHAPTRDAIVKTRRKTLLVAGVATEIIVQHSALSGVTRGYQVQVVVDACGGLSPRTEDAAFGRLIEAGVITTSIASIAGQLAGDFTTPKGAATLAVLYEMASG